MVKASVVLDGSVVSEGGLVVSDSWTLVDSTVTTVVLNGVVSEVEESKLVDKPSTVVCKPGSSGEPEDVSSAVLDVSVDCVEPDGDTEVDASVKSVEGHVVSVSEVTTTEDASRVDVFNVSSEDVTVSDSIDVLGS